MSGKVAVVDYGLGNLHSVVRGLTLAGADVRVCSRGAEILDCERVVVPGVGAFPDGMQGLRERGHVEALLSAAASGRPLLGICLGAQLLASESDEFGTCAGLGLIPGRVVPLPPAGVKIPHVGWKRLRPPSAPAWPKGLLATSAPGTWAYFVHSLHIEPADPSHLYAVVDHGPLRVTAAVSRDNVTGFQFHPEKSGLPGLDMLRAFVAQ